MLLEGQKVLITGASRGIGRATAIMCARHGADVGLNVYKDPDATADVVAEIEALGRKAFVYDGDVADATSAPAFVKGAAAALGGVTAFVSNAGICPFHSFLDMPQDVFLRTLNVNYTGAYYMCQAAANQMVEQGGGGSIIAVSSISALVGGEMQTHYTPTKAGVHSLMQSTAIALGRYGIRCNSVMPGTVATDINKDDLADPAKREYMEKRIPLGRMGHPDDIAKVVVFLASDLSSYVTGASVLTDGGMFVNLQ
ncbi:3-oxoacyl-acyl-carrier-protein reductase [Asticcacaulis biprosthecium C19]|uniref:L-rhamnose 1-dehydrogenase (NAD(P)(+)) n=1 Tax=Asticcacaulis biprosthecium C19 TaxID=715226 RepID=F4QSC1_9CAUL|nr:SDR family NAD(P)-dependent oxidoreductase [Asticcacaulis biprosthecium]EGF89641.1 3-oxoacyl-acyl-carrier-protein reductase [Asticcacaulis biprosthecium C19]